MADIAAAWAELEVMTAIETSRCGAAFFAAADLARRGKAAALQGAAVVPMAAIRPDGSHTELIYAVFGRLSHVRRYVRAFECHDDTTMGRLHGYPPCCIRAFVARRHGDDATLRAARHGAPAGSLNVLLRPCGILSTFHMPCSVNCRPSLAIQARLLKFGRRFGFAPEMQELEAILSWPTEWSSSHGIGEVKTPIFKELFAASFRPGKAVVQYRGRGYPAEGATGGRFPYRPPVRAHARELRVID
jgi:hypothetical protein